MSDEMTVAVLAFMGTVVGSAGGIIASSKLVNHRLIELERKVDKHNSYVERTYILEGKMENVDRRVDVIERKME